MLDEERFAYPCSPGESWVADSLVVGFDSLNIPTKGRTTVLTFAPLRFVASGQAFEVIKLAFKVGEAMRHSFGSHDSLTKG
jgi:hypothetical protein